ncbi:MAG: hypothetical protein JWO03_2624 [Bacteroidetes bacterium]|nr:hypothetical protein [Bacteroidota bacterium]
MKNDLVITPEEEKPLSKQQEMFNWLVAKIEALRVRVGETTSTLDANLEYHNKNIYPLEMQIFLLKKEVLKSLFSYYNDKDALSQNQRKVVLSLVKALLREVLAGETDKPDEEIQRIYEKVEGLSYEEAESIGFDHMKQQIEDTLENYDLYVDLSDMHKDMSEADMARKMHEINDAIREERERRREQKETKKRSKKQAARIEQERQMDEARSKNISTIYKQLVKILHPDLEQDDELRPLKEELMKELGIAYKKGDLHALLRLELEWVNRNTADTRKLTDDKLQIYNEVLKEQAKELEIELVSVINNPRYGLLKRFGDIFNGLKNFNLPKEKNNMELTLKSLTRSAERLKGAGAMGEIKDLIKVHKMHIDQN